MALFITNDGVEYEYHNGSKINTDNLNFCGTMEVQADGHELEAIKNQINGIPFSTHRVQRWYGDYAHFIASNLKL